MAEVTPMLKQNNSSSADFLKTAIGIFFGYIKYSQMVWMIIFWAMFLFIFFLSMIFVVMSSRPELLTESVFAVLKFLNISEAQVSWGVEEILWAYGIFSIVVFILAALFKTVLKIKLTLNLKQKILAFTGVVGGMLILEVIFISLAYYFSRDNTYLGYYLLAGFFALGTLVLSIYYLLVSRAIDYLNNFIDYFVGYKNIMK